MPETLEPEQILVEKAEYRIVYNDPDTNIPAVVIPAPVKDDEGTILGWVHRDQVIAHNVPEGVAYVIKTPKDIPADRYFRDAWRFDGRKIKVDMDASREVQKEKWRNVRTVQFPDSDIEFLQVLETWIKAQKDPALDPVKAVIEKREALRDVTNEDMSMFDTPDQLKEVWPAALGDNPNA